MVGVFNVFKNLIAVTFCLCFGLYANAQENLNVETLEQYIEFLEKAQATETASEEATAEYYRRSLAFWMPNKIAYNSEPEKFRKAMDLYHDGQAKYVRDRSIEIDRFESRIENFRRFDARNTLAKDPILFVGSSSMVYWETAISFPDYPIINRGFGGASLPEVIHYYDDVIKKHNPSMILVYCDIDVERGRSPEFAVNAFKELVRRIEQDFPETPVLLLSMKPTLIDDILGKDVRKNKLLTNQLLLQYAKSKETLSYVDITSSMIDANGRLKDDIFIADGMHLNPLGYELWDPIIKREIDNIRN
jgi:lysophospholipase L1-like esterase